MGMTATEKILAKAAGQDKVVPGEIVNVNINRLMVVDMSASIVFDLYEKLGAKKLWDKDRIVLVADHFGSGHDKKAANFIQKTRDCAKKYEIKNFFDHGRNGICHQVMAENGFVSPGKVTVGTDSHAPMYGAFGAFGCGVGSSEAAVAMATGQVWFRVPEAIRIVLTGEKQFGVYGKDVALKIMTILKCDQQALYKAVEIVGDGVKSLDMDDRLAICNMVVESGAKNVFMPCDEVVAEYLKDRTDEPYEVIEPDADAAYEASYEIDLNSLEPQIASPHTSDNAVPVKELEGTEITQLFLGSCTSGRLEEIALAAKILKGRKLPDSVVMRVSPSSVNITLEAVKLGYVETLMEAGCVFEAVGCGACGGLGNGVIPDGAVVVSTSNRNFVGRMGSTESFVYLASAATVAASAVEGKIADPRKYL